MNCAVPRKELNMSNKITFRNYKQYELELTPCHLSKTGLNSFKVLNCNFRYNCTKPKMFTMRLEMCNGQSKVVKFDYNCLAPDIVELVRSNVKANNTVYISLYNIRLSSYHYMNKTGISMYSSGFRIEDIYSC